MNVQREKRAKLNIFITLGCQLLTMICGVIVPRCLIMGYGSEAYGATASIAQFLGYIALLDGGISGVARAALYKPLADDDSESISIVVQAIRKFFNIIAIVFIFYTFVIACSFKYISHIKVLDWTTTFLLVIVISISTFAQYFIGISYSILLQAAQRTYVTSVINILATVINTIMVVFLVHLGLGLVVVKLVSSVIFAVRPLLLLLYVKKNFKLSKTKNVPISTLKDRWTGLGQHLAYFLHSHTDVAVLTVVLKNMVLVSIYSVYYMIINAVQSIVSSFSTGMESVFGDMYAKKEIKELNASFTLYETLTSIVSVVMFSSTAVLIIPFVRIYTRNVEDADYIIPALGYLLCIASLLTCLRVPYHNLTIAAGHFKQTKIAAYGEAIINIVLSILLVSQYGIIGVAIGTVVAVSFRFIYYVIYLSKSIINRSCLVCVKRQTINTVNIFVIVFPGNKILELFDIKNYFVWAVSAMIIAALSMFVTMLINVVFYRCEVVKLVSNVLKKTRNKLQ